jgi:hypothetical protein
MARGGTEGLEFLEGWYRQRCNGEWEKVNGVTIETLSTPGWLVIIDLVETPLENQVMPEVRYQRSDQDWLLCQVLHGKFHGEGDTSKLGEILKIFERWAGNQGPGGKSR